MVNGELLDITGAGAGARVTSEGGLGGVGGGPRGRGLVGAQEACMALEGSCQTAGHVQALATPQAARQAPLHPTSGTAQTHAHRVGDAIQPSHPVLPCSSCPQSRPASGSFLMSPLFASGGQGIGASLSVFPMNSQGSFPLGWTGLISLQATGLSRVFSNTTVQKHQFFST